MAHSSLINIKSQRIKFPAAQLGICYNSVEKKKKLPLEIFVSSFFSKMILLDFISFYERHAFLFIIFHVRQRIEETVKQKYRTVKQKFKLNTSAAALREHGRKYICYVSL